MFVAAGHQPNYLPWLGFFEKMAHCDVFIIEDNVQFEKQGFICRNRIKTADGVRWLTVPVEHVGHPLLINEAKIANDSEPEWRKRHWLTLKHAYCRAPYWTNFAGFFEQTYRKEWKMLIDLNLHIIRGLMRFLRLDKPLVMASSLGVSGKKSDLVLAQCKAVGADVQLCGSAAREYIQLKRFEEEGVKVVFQDFQYPIYPQLSGSFVPDLSVVDYLFCTGGLGFNEK